MKKYLALALVFTFALASCAKGPQPFDPNQFAGDKTGVTKAFTDVKKEKWIKKAKKVVIPSFQVEYIVVSGATSGSYDRLSGASAHASATYTMKGVGEETLKKITNKVYDDYVADLKANGIEVVSLEELKKNDHYQKLMAKLGKPAPYRETTHGEEGTSGESLFVAPYGEPIYFAGTDTKGGVLNAFGQFGSAFKGEAAVNFEGEIMHDFGDITLLKVRLVVGFASFEKSGSVGYTVSASIKGKMRAAIASKTSAMDFYPESGSSMDRHWLDIGTVGTLFLKKPVFSTDPIEKQIIDTTSTASRVMEGIANLLGAGTKSRDYDVMMDEKAYEDAVVKNLAATREMMAIRVKMER